MDYDYIQAKINRRQKAAARKEGGGSSLILQRKKQGDKPCFFRYLLQFLRHVKKVVIVFF